MKRRLVSAAARLRDLCQSFFSAHEASKRTRGLSAVDVLICYCKVRDIATFLKASDMRSGGAPPESIDDRDKDTATGFVSFIRIKNHWFQF